MADRVFHFSEDPGISVFEPRPVLVPSPRPQGQEWLNGPLVWAIDDWHSPMYLFPRECPRILIWRLPGTTAGDVDRWWGDHDPGVRMLAYVERSWFDRLTTAALYRYQLPSASFESLDDAGMYVSRDRVVPAAVDCIPDLPLALRKAGVELCAVDSLLPFKSVWDSTLHASGIRLRNAAGWV